MTPAAVILTVAVYIAVLFVVAYLSGRKADKPVSSRATAALHGIWPLWP